MLILDPTKIVQAATFGITGNGRQDTTKGFQDAANSLALPGNAPFDSAAPGVWLPEGIFLLSGAVLSWPISIIGSGWGTILKLVNGANTYALSFNPQSGYRFTGALIANLKIDCNGANQSAASGGIDAKGACYCTFDRVWIEAPYQYGISIHDDNLSGFGHHNHVHKCWFHNGTLSPASIGVGVQIVNSDENDIAFNTFESCGGTAANAAQLFESSSLQRIHDNVFVANPSVNGIEGLKVAGRNSIMGNIFDGGTNAQAELTGDYNTVIGNHFFEPINTSACLLVNGQQNAIDANHFESSVTANASKAAIDGSSASGPNSIGPQNVVKTNGSWSSGVYLGMNTTYQASGVPSNSLGNNGDLYYRTDTPGTANQRIYVKSAGAWSGIV